MPHTVRDKEIRENRFISDRLTQKLLTMGRIGEADVPDLKWLFRKELLRYQDRTPKERLEVLVEIFRAWQEKKNTQTVPPEEKMDATPIVSEEKIERPLEPLPEVPTLEPVAAKEEVTLPKTQIPETLAGQKKDAREDIGIAALIDTVVKEDPDVPVQTKEAARDFLLADISYVFGTGVGEPVIRRLLENALHDFKYERGLLKQVDLPKAPEPSIGDMVKAESGFNEKRGTETDRERQTIPVAMLDKKSEVKDDAFATNAFEPVAVSTDQKGEMAQVNTAASPGPSVDPFTRALIAEDEKVVSTATVPEQEKIVAVVAPPPAVPDNITTGGSVPSSVLETMASQSGGGAASAVAPSFEAMSGKTPIPVPPVPPAPAPAPLQVPTDTPPVISPATVPYATPPQVEVQPASALYQGETGVIAPGVSVQETVPPAIQGNDAPSAFKTRVTSESKYQTYPGQQKRSLSERMLQEAREADKRNPLLSRQQPISIPPRPRNIEKKKDVIEGPVRIYEEQGPTFPKSPTPSATPDGLPPEKSLSMASNTRIAFDHDVHLASTQVEQRHEVRKEQKDLFEKYITEQTDIVMQVIAVKGGAEKAREIREDLIRRARKIADSDGVSISDKIHELDRMFTERRNDIAQQVAVGPKVSVEDLVDGIMARSGQEVRTRDPEADARFRETLRNTLHFKAKHLLGIDMEKSKIQLALEEEYVKHKAFYLKSVR